MAYLILTKLRLLSMIASCEEIEETYSDEKENVEEEIISDTSDEIYDSKVIAKFQRICRLCSDDATYMIFNNLKYPNIACDIKKNLEVEIDENDGLPNRICLKCLTNLENFKTFRNIAQNYDEKFKLMKIKYDAKCKEESGTVVLENTATYKDLISCKKCGKGFSSRVLCRKHIVNCMRIPKIITYLCDICGKEFKTNAVYKRHRMQHMHKFPFKCDQCPYRGKFKDLLDVHRKSHLSIRPHKCNICDKTFTTSSNMRKHIATHSNKKHYKCETCDKMFKVKVNLKRHMQNIHSINKKKFCEYCGNSYSKSQSLYKHLRKVHNVYRPRQNGRLPAYIQENDDQSEQDYHMIQYEEPQIEEIVY